MKQRLCIGLSAAFVVLQLIAFIAPAFAGPPTNSAAPTQKEIVLSAGQAALEDEIYDLAARQFQQYLTYPGLSPADLIAGKVLLARALYGEKKYDDVLALLSPAQGALGVNTDGFVFWRASARYAMAQYDAALAEVADFENRFPGSRSGPEVLRLRGWCYSRSGRLADAAQCFGQYDQQYGKTANGPANLLDWARALAHAGDDNAAAAVFERLTSLPPEASAGQEARYGLGQVLIRQKKWDAAETLMQGLATQDGLRADRRSEAWYALGRIHEAQDELDLATNAVVSGIQYAPTPELKSRGSILLGQMDLKLKHVDEGIALLKAFVAANPRDPLAETLQLQVAEACLNAGMSAQAVDEYQHYVEAFTNTTGQAQALAGKGSALMNLNRFAEAATAFGKAGDLYVNAADKERCLFKVGDACFANGQYTLALEAYERLTRDFPGTALAPHARFQMGECIARMGRTDEAETNLVQLAQAYPQSAFAERALLRVAELAADKGRLQEACTRYERVMNTYTNGAYYDSALYGHGLACYQLLRFSEAMADFERILRDFPKGSFMEQAYYMRGWCLYMMGRNREAVSICTNFMALYPTSPWAPVVLMWIGRYEYNAAAYDKAEERFAALAERYPADGLADSAQFWAGRAAAKKGEFTRAIEHFAKLAKDYPNSPKLAEARFFQGEALSEINDYSSAILIFEEIISRYPTNALVDPSWLRKGDYQLTLGTKDPKRYQEAIDSYRMVSRRPAADPDLQIQAEYKIGRCYEKMGRTEEAFRQYYVEVVNRYLHDLDNGIEHGSASEVWFTRAAFNAADLMEAQKNWRQAVRILERVVHAGVPASNDASQRINRIRAEHWLFY